MLEDILQKDSLLEKAIHDQKKDVSLNAGVLLPDS